MENKKEFCCVCHRKYTRHMMMQTRQNTYKCIRCHNGGSIIITVETFSTKLDKILKTYDYQS
jgi:hypothetical protein